MATAKPIKLPKSLPACADLYYETRQKRLALQKEVDALQEQETEIKNHLIDSVPKTDASGVMGKTVRITVVTKKRPQVEDWDAFYEYVAKNRTKGSFALMNRAVNSSAVKEIWEAGKVVPGVTSYNVVDISVNKL
jgi:hypothetical protein